MLVACGLVCCWAAIRFTLRYGLKGQFTINSLLVSFVYLAMWTPAAIAHALNYSSFDIRHHDNFIMVTTN